MVSLEHLERFLRETRRSGITVWLAGLRPDLFAAFDRLNLEAWIARDHVFPQGSDEDSATLAAVRRIRSELVDQDTVTESRLYYRV
jgi:hypothetical protein